MGDVVVTGHLGLSDHEMIEVEILVSKEGTSKTTTTALQRGNFGLFRALLESVT